MARLRTSNTSGSKTAPGNKLATWGLILSLIILLLALAIDLYVFIRDPSNTWSASNDTLGELLAILALVSIPVIVVISFVFSIIGLRRARRMNSSRKIAIAGIVISGLELAYLFVVLLIWILD